jgi:1,4-alpha-glucan branching enzyme
MKDDLRAYTWGPTFMAGGGTRFRLWAPAEKAVALRIGGRDIP